MSIVLSFLILICLSLNGLELLKRLQKDHIEQTVIVVSTVAKEGAKETIQALEYGAFDFVTKPENLSGDKEY